MNMLHFIINPIAGKGRAVKCRRALERILDERGIPYAFHETHKAGDAKRIAGELTRAGEQDIVAVGGDGTAHEVLNGLDDPSNVRMGLIPVGSGDDFASAVGIPTDDPEAALGKIIDGKAVCTDFLACGEVRSLNVIGTGIDVEVLLRSYRARFLKGSLNYFVSLIGAALSYRCAPVTMRMNGSEHREEAFVLCACNGTQFGGGIGICPKAEVDDGLMDVVLIKRAGWLRKLGLLGLLTRRRILEAPETIWQRTERVQGTFDRKVTLQADGELYEGLPFDVRVVHDCLRMYR